jgi:hypothetical protein
MKRIKAEQGEVLIDDDFGPTTAESFVIKFWIGPVTTAQGRRAWRGHISHVNSKERRYVQRMGDLERFITRHLNAVGADLGWWWRIGRSLRLKRSD